MKCPHCGVWTRTVETRGTRRRRECGNGHRFTTIEVTEMLKQFIEHEDRLRKARRILHQKGYLK